MIEDLNKHLPAYTESFDYAFDNNIMLKWYPERIIGSCSRNNSLLELGIGYGFTTSRFSQYFQKHVVIDGSSDVIKQFSRQHPECTATIVQSYFEDFDSNEKFDVIVLGFILEHIQSPNTVLRRFRNFLSPNGRVFIAVPNGESLHRRFGYAAGLLDDMMHLGNSDIQLGHKRLYSVDSLTSELEQADFNIIRREGIFLKPMTTVQLQTLNLSPQIIAAMCEIGINYPELSAALLFEATLK